VTEAIPAIIIGIIQMSIPKPTFVSCDETSLKIKLDYQCPKGLILGLQYREPHQSWEVAGEISVSNRYSTIENLCIDVYN
jgi:hypothetical protein